MPPSVLPSAKSASLPSLTVNFRRPAAPLARAFPDVGRQVAWQRRGSGRRPVQRGRGHHLEDATKLAAQATSPSSKPPVDAAGSDRLDARPEDGAAEAAGPVGVVLLPVSFLAASLPVASVFGEGLDRRLRGPRAAHCQSRNALDLERPDVAQRGGADTAVARVGLGVGRDPRLELMVGPLLEADASPVLYRRPDDVKALRRPLCVLPVSATAPSAC